MVGMRALLVQARSAPTYWSYHYSLPFAGKTALLPPLGLATLAALLPKNWDLRIVDLHVEPLLNSELAWADVVLVSGMLAQSESIREVLRRARKLGKRTVVGGPAPTTAPESFPEADHVFRGEAEGGNLELLVAALTDGNREAPRILSPADRGRWPDLMGSPVPRFDLLDLSRYASLAIQTSRGCPFHCEFCDIVEIFGHVPRPKPAEQVLAELEVLWQLGARGALFFVDDNFIGNRQAVAKLLPRIAAWQEARGRPFDLYTEASLDLASEPEIVDAMVSAGFTEVFIGIETPSAIALESAGKRHNLRLDPAEAVARLTAAGLEVFAGFIVGFDSDSEEIFDSQIEFISRLAVPRAMVGLLTALPGTALWRRLEHEGRLRRISSGDQFERPNFETVMPERALLAGYRRVLETLYSSRAYYRRCEVLLRQARLPMSARRPGWAGPLLRAIWEIGFIGPRRLLFWKLLGQGLLRGPKGFSKAVTLAILGEHHVRYTQEIAVPRIDRILQELSSEGLDARDGRMPDRAIEATTRLTA
ncbi:MAG TPA: B12-binding domain-containing radical SAM protein [Anaeromyxobacteraceae bacterium]|nr:B12-binding domain-containing radical SAM protein [Anaeromyxobacteraceae bacterium]